MGFSAQMRNQNSERETNAKAKENPTSKLHRGKFAGKQISQIAPNSSLSSKYGPIVATQKRGKETRRPMEESKEAQIGRAEESHIVLIWEVVVSRQGQVALNS